MKCARRVRLVQRSRFNIAQVHRGFTLMEVLIAIALTMVLVGSMFGFLFDMLRSRSMAMDLVHQQRAATTVIERLEQDAFCSLVGDHVVGPGVRGNETQLRLLTRSVATYLAGRNEDASDVLADLQFVEYRFDRANRRIELRRGSAGTGASSTSESFDEFAPLAGVIHKLRFRYHDGQAWRSSFDSLTAGRLPDAIEVAIWFNPLPEEAALDDLLGSDRDISAADDSDDRASGNFDEYVHAMLSDLELRDDPPPDRIRVVLVPDADADEQPASAQDDGGGPINPEAAP